LDSFFNLSSANLHLGFFTVYFSTDILIFSSGFTFEPLQNYICIQVDEPVIVFFKLSNFSDEIRRFISLYDVVPFYLYPYLKKIQCFCFDEILVKPSEVLILPLFFVLDSSFINDFNPNFSSIHISYSLVLSA
jgi:cytochrome c oxidase assembly protein subunit 11